MLCSHWLSKILLTAIPNAFRFQKRLNTGDSLLDIDCWDDLADAYNLGDHIDDTSYRNAVIESTALVRYLAVLVPNPKPRPQPPI